MTVNLDKGNLIKHTLLNSKISTKKIETFDFFNSIMKIKLINTNFNNYDDIAVILKNIKNREVYYCDYQLEDNFLNVNLKDLSFLCTDYEYMLLIFTKTLGDCSLINPLILNNYNSKQIHSDTITDNKSIKWYLRILDNGEFRLSSIVKSI